jgi:stress-induced morphogen
MRELRESSPLTHLHPPGGCGQMFEAIIVSAQFEKKMTLARHRLVNAALKEEIAAIHAWTPKCFTPAEWEKKKGSA